MDKMKYLSTLLILMINFLLIYGVEGASPVVFKLSPSQSVEQIRDEIRVWRKADPARKEVPVEVHIPEGTWFFEKTVDLDPQDSNVSWIADGKAVFTRGKKIEGWKINHRGWFEVDLPEVAQGKWWFEQLYVNGNRAVCATSPNEFYHYILDSVDCLNDPATGKRIDTSRRAFVPRKSEEKLFETIAQKYSLNDVQIKFYHSWATSLHRIEHYDPENIRVLLTGDCRWNLTYWGAGKLRYQIIGIKEALDQPGEFFLDRKGTLTYIPKEGETPDNTTIIVPTGPCSFEDSGFFRIRGNMDAILERDKDPADSLYVSGIRMSGITFTVDPFHLPKEGLSTGQAAVNTPVSILIEGARNIEIQDCTFTHLGGYAIWFHRACSDSKVERSFMEDLGAGGIRIGTYLRDISIQKDHLITRRILAQNNLIRGYGQIEGSAIGIWIGSAADNRILHNEIANGFYTAISVGWVWGYAPSRATGNKINFNYLHHIGKGVLSDLGAVYTLGISPGTTVNNRIHDIYCFGRYGDGAAGLYTDEGSSDILFANNLVYKVHKGAIHQHYGKNNIFRNNIFAYSDFGMVSRSRDEDHLSFTLENNIFIWDQSPLFHRSWNRPNAYILKNNLYWFDGEKITEEEKNQKFFVGKTLADWQKGGADQGSLFANPGFVDSKKYDFHFKGGSPNEAVRAIGFQPFDFDLSGIEKNVREGWGKRYSHYHYPDLVVAPDPPLPPPFAIHENFESPRFIPVPKAVVSGKPIKQTAGITITAIQPDGSRGKVILSDDHVPMGNSSWNRLDWFGFCALGTTNATIDLDNIKIEGTQKDRTPYFINEDFGKIHSFPLPNTTMSFVKDEKAWSVLSDQGNKYLRINDSQRFKASFDPHFYYRLKDLIGKVRISFDVRLSENAVFYSEGREYIAGGRYLSGPTLQFKEGNILLPFKDPVPYTNHRWYRIEWNFEQDQKVLPPYEIKEEKGNHFVRMNDDPRFKPTFLPFFFYKPNYLEGKVFVSFKLRLSKDANLIVEGRNSDNPYKIGPRMFCQNGKLKIGQETVCDLSEDRWIQLSLSWNTGPNVSKEWDLAVSSCNSDGSIGEKIVKDRKYPFTSKDIVSFNEFYFIGAGTKQATIDLDDIHIHQ